MWVIVSASPRSSIPGVTWPLAPERPYTPVVTRTTPAGAIPDLLSAIPRPSNALSFVSEGEGIVGWGCFARFESSGPHAAADIAQWWAHLCERLTIVDDVGRAGTGPIVFVSLGFTDDDRSVAIVPRVLLGSRDGRRFTTVIGDPGVDAMGSTIPIRGPGQVVYSDGAFPVEAYTRAVGTAVDRIRAGALDKVVLAHDLVASTELPVDERYLLTRLAAAYPTCWTYAVDGLVGASPEMLVRRHGRRVSSRVLAGTAWPEHAGEHTAGLVATHLLASRKDLAEHGFAVESVAAVLRAFTDDVRVPRAPRALPLANLTHLVTDISARLPAHQDRTVLSPTSALSLAAKLHPTAAVGGSPRDAALRLIGELEPTGRGRYAAPIGWMDHRGNGEFALALRCAQVSAHEVRLTAGCGIVADSEPEVEAREAQIKMIPIRDALGS